MAAASTRRLKVDPLMRTVLGEDSLTGTRTPIGTVIRCQQNNTIGGLGRSGRVLDVALWVSRREENMAAGRRPGKLVRMGYRNGRLLV